MMLSKIPHSYYRYFYFHPIIPPTHCSLLVYSLLRFYIPTTEMPASSAALSIPSLSIITVIPASTARTRASVSIMLIIVVGPTVGRSNLVSCPGLHTLITTAPPLASLPPRRIVSSVPSTASTAITARSLTITHCPMSSLPISLAIVVPKRMSSNSLSEGPVFVSVPLSARIVLTYDVAALTVIPSFSSSPAIALRIVSSFLSVSPDRSANARLSGIKLVNRSRLLTPPAITASVTSSFFNMLINSDNWPNLTR